MEKITKNYKFNYDNDTTIEYVNTGMYSMLNCSFTSEDPDYGTDTLHFTLDEEKTLSDIPSIEELAFRMGKQIREYLDATDDGIYRTDDAPYAREYDEYSNSTLFAIEKALHEIIREPHLNNNGHYFRIGAFKDIIDEIRDALVDKTVSAIYVATDFPEDYDGYDPEKAEDWFKIVRMTPPFDNNPEEVFVMMGRCGGGNVATCYSYDDYDTAWFINKLIQMMKESTGENDDKTKFYFEFIGVNDKHSYEYSKEDK